MTALDRFLAYARGVALAGLLAVGLAGAIADLPAPPTGPHTTWHRDATPQESLLHDLIAERDRLAWEREAAQ
ncbi:hypothetical protein [Rhizomonospora bruguierae]|uniref:hypothetical protein n=1 Tax=Rhizomonospora bruguierae TaxID=1581705 RepID=UPI001BD00762|nr:hypothetical protein [Micromonospora sp. NBRC 107566]